MFKRIQFTSNMLLESQIFWAVHIAKRINLEKTKVQYSLILTLADELNRARPKYSKWGLSEKMGPMSYSEKTVDFLVHFL